MSGGNEMPKSFRGVLQNKIDGVAYEVLFKCCPPNSDSIDPPLPFKQIQDDEVKQYQKKVKNLKKALYVKKARLTDFNKEYIEKKEVLSLHYSDPDCVALKSKISELEFEINTLTGKIQKLENR